MKYEGLKFPQVAEIFIKASIRNSVWKQLRDYDMQQKELSHAAERENRIADMEIQFENAGILREAQHLPRGDDFLPEEIPRTQESGFAPRGVFFAETGRTEKIRQLARILGIPLVKFDMPEYSGESGAARLFGAAGYQEGGLLINAIRETPRCILLLNEIERAHPAIRRLLLQALDSGILTDCHGRTADFRQLYLVMTGNPGPAELSCLPRISEFI